MLVYLRNSIFESPAQTLVNTVNLEGVMGKGIAAEFKARYPEMFLQYRAICKSKALKIGDLHLWRGADKWVLNFPTKTTWRKPSTIDYVEAGLEKFVRSYEGMSISSVSFPPLGCGNGQLHWEDVRPIMERYLKRLPIHVYIHDRQVPVNFVAEYNLAIPMVRPVDYISFLQNVKSLIYTVRGEFHTIEGRTPFHVSISDNGDVRVRRGDKTDLIHHEELERAWEILQAGILTSDSYSGESRRRYKSYLFSILSQLPYLSVAYVQHVREGNEIAGHGLYITPSDDIEFGILSNDRQGTLWGSQ